MSPNGTLTVTTTITNTGSVAGDDVVQLYLHEDFTTILQPVEKLEGFQRVTLAPGQSTTVRFKLGRQNFGFYNNKASSACSPDRSSCGSADSSDVSALDALDVHGRLSGHEPPRRAPERLVARPPARAAAGGARWSAAGPAGTALPPRGAP